MADNDKKQKEAETAAPAAPEKASLFSKKNIIILSVLLIVIGAGAFAGIKMIGKNTKKDAKKEESSSEHKKESFIYTFKPLITNIAGTNASRFLKVTVSLQYEERELEKIFDEKNAIFLDTMNGVFSSLTLEQVTEITQRDGLKREIRDKINEILAEAKKPQIKNIFFSEYICQ